MNKLLVNNVEKISMLSRLMFGIIILNAQAFAGIDFDHTEEDFSHQDLSNQSLACIEQYFAVTRPSGGGVMKYVVHTVDYTGANFTGANLENANLTGLILDNANFENANLRGATLYETSINGANFRNADLRDIIGQGYANTRIIYGTMLSPVSFPYLGTDFSGALLPANWFFANQFEYSRFTDMDLSNQDLTYAILKEVDFTGSDLSNIQADLTIFDRSIFIGANLAGANFSTADKFETVIGDHTTTYTFDTLFPSGFDPVSAGWTLVAVPEPATSAAIFGFSVFLIAVFLKR